MALLGAALHAGQKIPVTSPAVFLSPYNTTAQGEWIYPGGYLKTTFTGTRAVLHIDTQTMQGPAPKFRWSIDGGPLQTAQASSTLPLAAGLRPGRHALTVWLAATDANYDRWRQPQQIVRLKSLEIDDGAKLSAPRGLHKKRAVFFGDSITEGAWNLGNSYRVVDKKWVDWVKHSDATEAWPFFLAARMGVEYGVIGSGGMSWLRPSHSSIPPFPEAWRFHYQGHPRDFRPAPDYVVVNMGTNDGTRDTAPAVTAWLREVLRTFPKAQIWLFIPFGQQNKGPLEAALAAVSNKRIHKIDLGPANAQGLNKYGAHSATSHDGLHPKAATHRSLAEAVPLP